jgi:hypothetical protein
MPVVIVTAAIWCAPARFLPVVRCSVVRSCPAPGSNHGGVTATAVWAISAGSVLVCRSPGGLSTTAVVPSLWFRHPPERLFVIQPERAFGVKEKSEQVFAPNA